MKRVLLLILIASNFALIFGQTNLTNEGTTVNNTITGEWEGVNIPRSVPTLFTYRNNSVTSVNSSGYMLQAGDEAPMSNNNNLDGEVITGNKFNWAGTYSSAIITHGLFAGYNTNQTVKYNYLNNVPYGIVFKSGTDAGVNMTNSSGVCAYNIVRNGKFAGRVKGMNGIKFYNNTFYSGDGHGWYLLLISNNMDRVVPAGSQNTQVFNNIFYSTVQIPMIEIYDNASLTGFKSDYNVFYCEDGEPTFNIAGVTKTWAQWQALGYDTHSTIVNPNFINTTDFVPAARLNYGTNLGTAYQTGLSTTATWTVGSSPATTNQNGTWQVGARIFDSGTSIVNPTYLNSIVENSTPAIIVMNFNLSMANIVPAISAFSVMVNAVARPVSAVNISGTKVQLTLSSEVYYGDIVSLTYTKPLTNPLQTSAGGMVLSIPAHSITNNILNPAVAASPVTVIMTIFPNHVYKILSISLVYSGNISALATAASPEIIRITDTYGKLYSEKVVETGVASIKIPLNLSSGIYIVKLLAGGLELASQKIIVY
jgi:hypothetical protein